MVVSLLEIMDCLFEKGKPWKAGERSVDLFKIMSILSKYKYALNSVLYRS